MPRRLPTQNVGLRSSRVLGVCVRLIMDWSFGIFEYDPKIRRMAGVHQRTRPG